MVGGRVSVRGIASAMPSEFGKGLHFLHVVLGAFPVEPMFAIVAEDRPAVSPDVFPATSARVLWAGCSVVVVVGYGRCGHFLLTFLLVSGQVALALFYATERTHAFLGAGTCSHMYNSICSI